MRNDRNKQVGGILTPAVRKKRDQRFVKNANGELQDAEEVGTAPGPAIAEEDIVLLLDTEAGQAAKHVEVVGKLLELD